MKEMLAKAKEEKLKAQEKVKKDDGQDLMHKKVVNKSEWRVVRKAELELQDAIEFEQRIEK